VNCLQFFIFTRFFAVFQLRYTNSFLLWIAYNFLSLQGSLQLLFEGLSGCISCELLTIFYLYKVLCSSVGLEHSKIGLWIAYNFLSLQGSLQYKETFVEQIDGCELLTIFYLYKVLCSVNTREYLAKIVVNCLQFFIFTRFFAVIFERRSIRDRLWIAYNFLSLQGSLQSFNLVSYSLACCELLTIFYLYKVLCSRAVRYNNEVSVVNCLQFFIFTRFFAVARRFGKHKYRLWIAYNFLSLQGSLQ